MPATSGERERPLTPRLRTTLRARFAALRLHALPLLLVALAVLVGQVVSLTRPPFASQANDSQSYVVVADVFSHLPTSLLPGTRTPGYPALLSLVFGLFGARNYAAVVWVQAAIMVLTVFEIYLLVYRVSGRRVAACLVAVALALNLYLLDWERSIMSETLAVWSLVTAFLVFASFVHRPTPRGALALALLLFLVVLVHPFSLVVAVVLFALLLARAWRAGDLAREWQPIVLSGTLFTVCVLGYMAANQAGHGTFAVTPVSGVNLFGKVLEYGMQADPVPSRYRALQADAEAYARAHPGNPDPWAFLALYPRYKTHGYALLAAYGTYVAEHHVPAFIADSIPDMSATWRAQPLLYAPYGLTSADVLSCSASAPCGLPNLPHGKRVFWPQLQPPWVPPLLALSLFEQGAILLLPLLLLWLVVCVWRAPGDRAALVQLALAASIVGAIVLAGLDSTGEFYRLRFPLDWAAIAVGGIALIELASHATAWLVARYPRLHRLPGAPARQLMLAGRSPVSEE